MFERSVRDAVNQSVQVTDVNKDDKPFEVSSDWGTWGILTHDDILSAWGTKERGRQLRRFSYAVHNGLVQGAFSGFIKRVQAIPWELKGGRNTARYYQGMLQNSDFHDWESFIARLLWDYLTQDFGAVAEVIGNGSADKVIRGRVSGIAAMDSLSCYATKVFEYPVIYYNEEANSRHVMHTSRVYRFVDSPSPKRLAYGTGLCALSRYISDAHVDILLGRYDNELLSDLPMPGLLAISGIGEQQFNDTMRSYEANRHADGQHTFRQTAVIHSLDPTITPKFENIPFSVQPTNFDPESFIRVHVNKLALAMGVDPQDIWPLSSAGAALGTATQSAVLNSKAQGKLFGSVLQMITRFLNRAVLPDDLEFAFKFKDTEADLERANTAAVWVTVANTAMFLSDEEKRRLLVDNVEAFAEVLLDDAGEMIELPDDDPKPPDVPEVIAPDDIPNSTAPADANAFTQTDDTANQQPSAPVPGRSGGLPQFGGNNKQVRERSGVGTDVGGRFHADTAQKDYPDTKSEFVDDVAAIISDASAGEINPAAFAIRMRAALSKFGKSAYLDGLAEGGIDVSSIPPEDSDIFAGILAAQSQYVTDARSTITDFGGDAKARAQMWQKSLDPFYYGAVESADKNGLYTFDGDDGAESCKDCRALKGQTHRMSWWIKNRKRPVVDAGSFECGGWHCQHMLKKKTKAA
jgi:hypothetical protein